MYIMKVLFTAAKLQTALKSMANMNTLKTKVH